MNTFTKNAQFDGIEIHFDTKPGEEIRERLKAAGFRWHKQKGVWYAKNKPETLKLAQALCGAESEPDEEEPKKNAHGVMVGDLFKMVWGYDQTNVDWFQVVALVGANSARVREVCLPVIKEEGICWLASNITYETSTKQHPANPRSIWIKDQERGDLKRVTVGYGGIPTIKVGDHYARLHVGDTARVYESDYA